MFTTLFLKRKKVVNPDLLRQLDKSKLPKHVAIIMDGNGRWAARRGLPRSAGHQAGVESLRSIVEICCELGISILTVYAFSTENWKRPQEEVDTLMNLLTQYLQNEINELHRKNIKINPIGRLDQLPESARKELERAADLTKNNNRLILNLALNYGGRAEIVDAVKVISKKIAAGTLSPAMITEETIAEHLYTRNLPDPDLLIRPSGEYRISNFLLWQIAYTEFWITEVLWPEFNSEHLIKALLDYTNRERRFGGLKI
ncbi:MAG TPA: isoprenyl transferase [Clostridia bacterium]|nr:isoprenyl transferase [Clostridia bacterium]